MRQQLVMSLSTTDLALLPVLWIPFEAERECVKLN